MSKPNYVYGFEIHASGAFVGAVGVTGETFSAEARELEIKAAMAPLYAADPTLEYEAAFLWHTCPMCLGAKTDSETGGVCDACIGAGRVNESC